MRSQPVTRPAEPARPASVPPEIAAEAAVWVARLHGPGRSRALERECLAWQARSKVHQLAFERCTDTWQDVSGLSLSVYAAATEGTSREADAPSPRSGRLGLIATALLGCAVTVALWLSAGQRYETARGEQLAVTLADGTRMMLNTATEVDVDLTSALRKVHVRRGEVLFEVAKEAHRPFVVQVADAKVVATGTQFLVRTHSPATQTPDAFGVTLIEGEVVVERTQGIGPDAPVAAVVLKPGQQVRGDVGAAGSHPHAQHLHVERAKVEQATAWLRGQVVFDDTPLADAIAEMNRYGGHFIHFKAQPELGARRISGTARTGDSESFAHAVANLYGLEVRAAPGRLELVPAPSKIDRRPE